MNNTNSAGVLAVLDPQAELGVKQSTKNANAGFVDWRDWCAYIGKAAQARAAVAELIEAASAAHMALIGYLPEHRNAVTSCAIARIEAALAALAGNGKEGGR